MEKAALFRQQTLASPSFSVAVQLPLWLAPHPRPYRRRRLSAFCGRPLPITTLWTREWKRRFLASLSSWLWTWSPLPGPASLDFIVNPLDHNQNKSGLLHCYAKLLQSCQILCNTVDHSPPDSSVPGILQAWILEWVALTPPGALPHPGIKPASLISPTLAGGFFTTSSTWGDWLLPGRISKEMITNQI